MDRAKLAQYGGRVLADGTLELRDPNDNARHRYQYRLVGGEPRRRVLPEEGDYDPSAEWEPLDLRALAAAAHGYHPVVDYFRG